jgi:hypothetical protein
MTLLPEVRNELMAIAARRAASSRRRRALRAPGWVPRLDRGGRARVWSILSATPLIAALVTSVAIAAVAIVLLGRGHSPQLQPSTLVLNSGMGLPPVPQMTPANLQALRYLQQARQTVLKHDRTCIGRPVLPLGPSKPDRGSPDRTMLSTFGVLRRPAGARPPLPPAAVHFAVFVRYARVAQRQYGSVYTVFPVKRLPAGGANIVASARCRNLELAALRTELAHAPKQLRARALRLGNDQLLDEQYVRRHPEGICLFGGGGGCQPFLYAQARGGLQSTGYGSNGSIFDYLVPDGVATVTARYPAEGPKTGFRRHIPALTITARVINNVAVWRLPHEPGDVFPTTITWRSASRRILRTIDEG